MKRIFADTGPIVALIDRNERYHDWAREQFAALRPPLYSCEAVIAESVYLLASVGHDATAPLDLIARGVLRLDFELEVEHAAVRALIARYAPRMDLADACLVRMTELHKDSRILTLDGDFVIYRRHGRNVVPTMMPTGARPLRKGRRHRSGGRL